MRETHPQTILGRKAARLRRETGNLDLESKLDRHLSPQQILLASFIRPMKLLIFSPIVLILSIYVALIYGLLYLLFTTFSTVFEGQYGFSTGISGLAYLGIGVGELVGLFVFGALSDRILKAKMAADNLTQPKPEYRLILMIWFAPIIPVGLFIYGWTAYYKVHWFIPIFGTFFVGYGSFFVIVSTRPSIKPPMELTFVILTDAVTTLSCGSLRLRSCRFCSWSKHLTPISRRYVPAARRSAYVQQIELWVGQHIAWLPSSGIYTSTNSLL